MNTVIILAGGVGTRLGKEIPKQYIMVGDRPILMYCLDVFQKHPQIDKILIVAACEWRTFVTRWIEKLNINKFVGYANPGLNRQHSILNGLKKANSIGCREMDNIIIHDAARPNISMEMISKCINGLEIYDGILPTLPLKDTVYMSIEGNTISSLLNRDHIFIGQSPESFHFGPYYKANTSVTMELLASIRGSCEIAYMAGMKIGLISGDEHNYKITTKIDLEKFITEQR